MFLSQVQTEASHWTKLAEDLAKVILGGILAYAGRQILDWRALRDTRRSMYDALARIYVFVHHSIHLKASAIEPIEPIPFPDLTPFKHSLRSNPAQFYRIREFERIYKLMLLLLPLESPRPPASETKSEEQQPVDRPEPMEAMNAFLLELSILLRIEGLVEQELFQRSIAKIAADNVPYSLAKVQTTFGTISETLKDISANTDKFISEQRQQHEQFIARQKEERANQEALLADMQAKGSRINKLDKWRGFGYRRLDDQVRTSYSERKSLAESSRYAQ